MRIRHCRCCYLLLASLFSILNRSDSMSPQVVRAENKQDEVEKLMQAYFEIDENNERKGSSANQRFEDLLRKLGEENLVAQDKAPADISPAVYNNKFKSSENQMAAGRGDEQISTSINGSSIHKMKVPPPNEVPDAENDEQPATTPSTTTSTTAQPLTPPPSSVRPKAHANKFARGTDAPVNHQSHPTKAAAVARADVLSQEDLKSFFINSGRGSSILIPGCDLVHFHIKSRCSGNLLELSLLSRSPLRGQVRILEGDGEVLMEGTNLVAYGVLGPLAPSGNMWTLTKDVLKKDLQKDCYICDSMSLRVVIEAEEATCGMVVTCQQKGSSRIVNVEDKIVDLDDEMPPQRAQRPEVASSPPAPPAPKSGPSSHKGGDPPIQDPGNTAKTTMTLVYSPDNVNIEEMAGMPVTGRVSIGTRMNLILSVFSKDVALDLHVVRCQAKSDDGRGVYIVKDGCSISSVIGEFRETLSIVQETSFGSHTVRKVSQHAEVRAFNFRRSPQNITLICTIKMCGGECTERPTCVDSEINLSRSTRPPVPIFTQEVTLGKVFHVGGFPLDPSPEISNLMLDTVPNRGDPIPGNCPDGCVAFRTVIIMLCFITAVYLCITVVAVYYIRRTATKDMKGYHMDDFESPPRAYYPEYSSPRRRTPQTSPEHTSFSISSEEKNSPSYGKKVKE